MILDWLAQTPAIAAAMAVLFVPGLLISAAGRMRGLALWAFAPVASTAAAGALALVYGAVALPWNAMTFGAGVIVLTALAWLVARWCFPTAAPRGRHRPTLLIVALILGGALIAFRLSFYIGVPDAISQTNDAVFHLNALRYIEQTGSASSLTLTGVLGAQTFYPGGWHALVSVVMSLNGGDIPVAVNATSLVISAMVWPAGLAWFARTVSGSQAVAAVAAAMAGAMLHFPMLMFEWGVLYPNALALALLPAALSIAWNGVGSRTDAQPYTKRALRLALLALIALVALGLAQPVVVLTWALLIGVRVVVAIATGSLSGMLRKLLLIAGVGAVIIAMWLVMATVSGGAHWGPYGGWAEALGELALTSQVDLPPSPVITVLAALGAVVAWRQGWRMRPLVLSWSGLALLMFAATAIANPLVRRWMLGPWYADPYRIAATLPVVMVPLAAVGLLWSVRAILARVRAFTPAKDRDAQITVTAAVAGGAVALLLWPVLMLPLAPDREVDEESRYASGRTSYLSPDERALLTQLDTLVEQDAVIIGNPSTGSGFGYALSGANVFPKNWSHPRTDAWELIGDHLRDAAHRPDVCEALEVYGSPSYVLDFGPGENSAGRFRLWGMTGFETVEGFELVAREGEAALWRITACNDAP